MKTAKEVHGDKLRGGFYTPESLVDVCLDRVAELGAGKRALAILEPSIGDGAFLRRLVGHPLAENVERLLGLEVIEAEAQKCREVARTVPFDAAIRTISALAWAVSTDERFDVVVGNPPFVRFQFVAKDDLRSAEQLGRRMELSFRGVSNLWIPILLGALDRLRPGGVMALVVPSEIFTGFSAGDVRAWLLGNFTSLRVDMFAPGSFPGVLQEVVVISGRRAETTARASATDAPVQFVEHGGDRLREWTHPVPLGVESWTRYLLNPAQLEALAEAQGLAGVQRFGEVAKLEVSIVTGANDFFSVTAEELTAFGLQAWAEPLLPRIRHAGGLVYTRDDHAAMVAEGAKAWLLSFDAQRPDPLADAGASRYLALGERHGLHERYKTSIRTPWYHVPSIWTGKLMLSKRSHWYPRLVYNAANVLTTDTIYRGNMLPQYEGRDLDLVAAFHNSLTLLTAEIEGHSFGGGVLELVPSEIARLSVPFPVELGWAVPELTQVARHAGADPGKQALLIEATDTLVCRHVRGLTPQLMCRISQAREFLMRRRLSRN